MAASIDTYYCLPACLPSSSAPINQPAHSLPSPPHPILSHPPFAIAQRFHPCILFSEPSCLRRIFPHTRAHIYFSLSVAYLASSGSTAFSTLDLHGRRFLEKNLCQGWNGMEWTWKWNAMGRMSYKR